MSRPMVGQWTDAPGYPGYQIRVSSSNGTLWVGIRKGVGSHEYTMKVPSEQTHNAEELNAYLDTEIRTRIADMENSNG
ncbi:hypothetical protein QFZ22_003782 [Streptomyces canus]|uniref:Uncharacterized protein n=1 Tax=Streptomyces canus TaxID=58343 RepID=A0AAW8FDA0_9ACTN|nr:hypothetical protein [Streptomyces canus]